MNSYLAGRVFERSSIDEAYDSTEWAGTILLILLLWGWVILIGGSWLYYRGIAGPSVAAMAYDAQHQLKRQWGCHQNVQWERCYSIVRRKTNDKP